MELLKCDLNTHSIAVMLRQFQINPKSIIHAGAHDLLSSEIYAQYDSKVIAFEANPYTFLRLKYRIKDYPKQRAIQACLWNKDGEELELNLYRSNTDGAASLLKPDEFNNYHPDCKLTGETIKMKTSRLDRFIEDGVIDVSDVDFLVVDLQGVERQFYEGAHLLLFSSALKYIWTEVAWGPIYQGGSNINEIDTILDKYGFQRVHVRQDWALEGDALYVRS